MYFVTVEESSAIFFCVEKVVEGWCVDYAADHFAAHVFIIAGYFAAFDFHYADGNGVEWEAVGEVERSVERIDDPDVGAGCELFFAGAAFLGEDGVVGEFFFDFLDDEIFCSDIYLGN